MTIEEAKRIIELRERKLQEFIKKAKVANRYYLNQNDILKNASPTNRNNKGGNEETKILSRSDNRISNNFHQLLVDQKAAYALSTPPSFDVDESVNADLTDILGDRLSKISNALAVEASNTSVGWLHVWRAADDSFKYAVVNALQIVPIFSTTLDNELEVVLRIYSDDDYTYYEIWNSVECYAFKLDKSRKDSDIETHLMFDLDGVLVNNFRHEWGRVPFIPFFNNARQTSDLDMYKALIDVYDMTLSGFVNDVWDVQEVILILRGYGGESIQELWDKLRGAKAIDVDEGGGVDKLEIDIPVSARETLLEMTRKRIFEAGQGLDPLDERVGSSSGVALKFKYSLLEMKSAQLETEFRFGFAELIRFILIYLGKNPDEFKNVQQTWIRTAINNDLEHARIVAQLASITSKENIAKSNPIVDDWEHELEMLAEEETKDIRMLDDYTGEDDE